MCVDYHLKNINYIVQHAIFDQKLQLMCTNKEDLFLTRPKPKGSVAIYYKFPCLTHAVLQKMDCGLRTDAQHMPTEQCMSVTDYNN